MTERAPEAGFAVLEVVVCVALLLLGSVYALALLPPLARASQTGLLRSAAADIARNALERARAAAAYYPAAAPASTADHAWALGPSATYVAAARVHRALCGTAAPATDVPMSVTLTYDASSDTLTVVVSYPPDPCVAQTQAQVTISAQLAPAAYAPLMRLPVAIADPALQ